MSDRELLELAAKAAGYNTNHHWNAERLTYDPPVVSLVAYKDGELISTAWNPLENDGDALRLAVKLNLELQIDFNEEEAKVYVYGGWIGAGIEEELGEPDRYQATRRAIVRAAAEIAKAKGEA